MLKIANEKGMKDVVHEGVYCFCGGPSYETPAESRMLAMLGADVTGESHTERSVVRVDFNLFRTHSPETFPHF